MIRCTKCKGRVVRDLSSGVFTCLNCGELTPKEIYHGSKRETAHIGQHEKETEKRHANNKIAKKSRKINRK